MPQHGSSRERPTPSMVSACRLHARQEPGPVRRSTERGYAGERAGDLPLVVLALDGVSRDLLYDLRQATPSTRWAMSRSATSECARLFSHVRECRPSPSGQRPPTQEQAPETLPHGSVEAARGCPLVVVVAAGGRGPPCARTHSPGLANAFLGRQNRTTEETMSFARTTASIVLFAAGCAIFAGC